MPTRLRSAGTREQTEHMRHDVSRRPDIVTIAAGSIFALTLAALVSQIADGVRSVWPWTAASFPAPSFYYVAAVANIVAIFGALVAMRSPGAGGFMEIAAAFVGGVAIFLVPEGIVPGYATLVVSEVLWCSLALVVGVHLIGRDARTRPRKRVGRSLVWI